MKETLIIIFICFWTSFNAQTKKDTVTLENFSVDKKGKTVLTYKFLDGASVKYKIEGKNDAKKWVLLNEGGIASIIAYYSGQTFSQTDTFTLTLNGIKEIRLQFIEPKSHKNISKTLTIP